MRNYCSIILIVVLLFPSIISNGQERVANLRSIVVQDEGGIRLFWTPPEDAVGFEKYEVFVHFSSAAVFQKIATISNYNQNTYVHNTPVYTNIPYYIASIYNDGSVYRSDTLQCMIIHASCEDGANINVNWDPLSENTLVGFDDYILWSKIQDETDWQEVVTTQESEYSYDPGICADGFVYRVSRAWNDSLSISNMSFPLENIISPEPPRLDSVSVTSAGFPVLGWQRSTSADAAAYRIHIYNSGWELYKDIANPDSLWFIDSAFNACQNSRTYRMATADRCGNIGFALEDAAQRNIVIKEPINFPCEEKIELEFETSYINMYPSFKNYSVFVSENSNPQYLLGIWEENQEVFIHENVERGVHYEYRVVANNTENNIHSRACVKSVFSHQPKKPEFGFIRDVSVDTTFVEVNYSIDTSASQPCYYLFRANDVEYGNLNFLPIDTLCGKQSSPNIRYVDSLTNPRDFIYHYRLETEDSCERVYPAPLDAANICLQAKGDIAKIVKITWNAYDGFEDGVDEYLLYRRVAGVWSDSPIEILSSDFTETEDSDVEVISNFDILAYRLAAISYSENFFGEKDTAWSNITFVRQINPQVWIPNVFTPWRTENTIFKPYFDEISHSNYSLVVYNRWGHKMFETQNPDEGWDGRINGKKANSQVYVFILQYVTKKGNSVRESGPVLLLD